MSCNNVLLDWDPTYLGFMQSDLFALLYSAYKNSVFENSEMYMNEQGRREKKLTDKDVFQKEKSEQK